VAPNERSVSIHNVSVGVTGSFHLASLAANILHFDKYLGGARQLPNFGGWLRRSW
jgi:hypothetical protein